MKKIIAIFVVVLLVVTGLIFDTSPKYNGVLKADAAAVLADTGADLMLIAFFQGTAPGNLTLRLFCTNTTPADTDTVATYTECSGGGYSAMTLTQGSWTITTGNDPSDALYTAQTFTFTGPLTTNTTIYGYLVTQGTTTLFASETLATSFTPTGGYTLTITPRFKLSKGTAN